MISALDVGRRLWWADPELVEAVIALARLPEDDAAALRDAAARHHGRPGPDTSGGTSKAA